MCMLVESGGGHINQSNNRNTNQARDSIVTPANSQTNNNKITGSAAFQSRVDRTRNMPVIINHAATTSVQQPASGHGIALSGSEEAEVASLLKSQNGVNQAEATTLPTGERKSAIFVLVSNFLVQGNEPRVLDVEKVIVNMGGLISDDIKTAAFKVNAPGGWFLCISLTACKTYIEEISCTG